MPAAAGNPPGPPGPPPPTPPAALPLEAPDRVLRVTADNLNRLLALAGESLVESRWLRPFTQSLMRLKRLHRDAGTRLEALRAALPSHMLDASAQSALLDAEQRMLECHQLLSQRLAELETFDHRSADLAHRLYDEALAVRMRPFADGIQGFPRMVRDLARSLGKSVTLEIAGEATEIDRDILDKLEAPLGHLLRNAIDHGIESPGERRAAGKPAEAVVHLEARHSAGMLQVIVADDGHGIDLPNVRKAVVARNLTNAETAHNLSEAELLAFLFLPGFTMKEPSPRFPAAGWDSTWCSTWSTRCAARCGPRPSRAKARGSSCSYR
jgi:two-component system sensor histidine kinase and response regulator WspE